MKPIALPIISFVFNKNCYDSQRLRDILVIVAYMIGAGEYDTFFKIAKFSATQSILPFLFSVFHFAIWKKLRSDFFEHIFKTSFSFLRNQFFN